MLYYPRRNRYRGITNSGCDAVSLGMCALIFCAVVVCSSATVVFATTVGKADNFTDIFYTNSFRGAFTWIEKMDWVGMIVQIVISTFSLFGVALLTIRIMTSLLYLSSKGMWEEVHDLKNSGGESEMFDFGLINMAKSWAKGKAGTGLDAIIGAVLILLPDVKKYSDFGEKAKGDFSDDMTVTQYMLKIALPTVMTVFFFAMGFNGTLFQALAVTVDAMGTVADHAVSVNYAGFVDDLVNGGTGYKFIFSGAGTNSGALQQDIATYVYGEAVSAISDLNAEQLYQIGLNVEAWVTENFDFSSGNAPGVQTSTQIADNIKQGLQDTTTADQYTSWLTYTHAVNGSSSAVGALSFPLTTEGAYKDVNNLYDAAQQRNMYVHIWIKQKSNTTSNYFSRDTVVDSGGSVGSGGGSGDAGGQLNDF